ncbi:MAG: UDP-N-acetylmuramate dehydrogenase [Candidatus Dasytiphilus stammeri]
MMKSDIFINKNNLMYFNTLRINVKATKIVIINTIKQLIKAWKESQGNNLPILLLGEGSNILFLEDYQGTVILNRLRGMKITEHIDSWHLHVSSGELWHLLVEDTLKKGILGLENLAMIPGCVGSAPIQNIGAYGVEFEDFCEYVELLDLVNNHQFRLLAKECQFKYRDSIFKHDYRKNYYFITAVGLYINKYWSPNINYSGLANLNPKTVTAKQIFDTVCYIRSRKLPNPILIGNAGSFFKNPIIDVEQASNLLEDFPDIPYYIPSYGRVKIAAGWLIEQCNLKGYRNGGAAVHRQNAMILINENHATGWDIAILARKVRQKVGEKFNIWLEPEVRFIDMNGEVNALEVIA